MRGCLSCFILGFFCCCFVNIKELIPSEIPKFLWDWKWCNHRSSNDVLYSSSMKYIYWFCTLLVNRLMLYEFCFVVMYSIKLYLVVYLYRNQGRCVEGLVEIFDMLVTTATRFRMMRLRGEEFICLKSIILLNSGKFENKLQSLQCLL